MAYILSMHVMFPGLSDASQQAAQNNTAIMSR